MKRTKIVCTLGPATNNRETIKKLIDAGMNAIRLNFSHLTPEEAIDSIKLIKQIRKERNVALSLILDTKGPEVRVYGYKEPIKIEANSIFVIKSYEKDDIASTLSGEEDVLLTNLPYIGKLVKVGQKVLMMDGFLEAHVVEVIDENTIKVSFTNSGLLKSAAHLSIPHINYGLKFLSQKDKQDIAFAIQNEFEYIALSFVSSKEDLLEVKKLIETIDKSSKTKLISKIENKKAVDNIEQIIEHSDGIMVARGDLGVENDIEKVPVIQKRIIRLCYSSGKPVITATQMLESMIDNPIPTRAEASDVANAVYDLSSAVMLSGETAIGKFPIRVVETMTKIIKEVENSLDFNDILTKLTRMPANPDITTAIATRAVHIAYDINAKAIVVVTTSGYAARMVSKVRPKLPIIAYTFDFITYNQLALNWGVFPRIIEKCDLFEELIKIIRKDILKLNFVEKGDNIILVSGLPIGKEGTTNSIRVEIV
ncbi:MAG TPA: pyruvate kinase [Exilispira sp.]|nr:pyruvate kinase [Exilispira sp.]